MTVAACKIAIVLGKNFDLFFAIYTARLIINKEQHLCVANLQSKKKPSREEVEEEPGDQVALAFLLDRIEVQLHKSG